MASLIYGGLCGLVMFSFLAYLGIEIIVREHIIFPIKIAISFLVGGYFSWYLIIARKKRLSARTASLIYGVLCGIVGLFFAEIIEISVFGRRYLFYIFLAVSSFCSGAFFWFLIIERKKKFGIIRGLFVSIATTIASHYLVWFLMGIAANIFYYIFDEKIRNFGSPPVNILGLLIISWITSICSIVFTGYLTLIVCVIVTFIFGAVRSRMIQ